VLGSLARDAILSRRKRASLLAFAFPLTLANVHCPMGEEKALTRPTPRGPAALPKAQMSEACAQRLLRNATATKVKRFDSADYFMHLAKRQPSAVPCSTPGFAPSSAPPSAPSSAPPSAPSSAPSSARSDTLQDEAAAPVGGYRELDLPALALAEDMEIDERVFPPESRVSYSFADNLR